jgi:uncharacterized protein
MRENGNPTMRRKLARAALHIFRLLLFAMVAFLVLFHAGVAYWVAQPGQAPNCCAVPTNWGAAYRDVNLQAPDGVSLSGWYIPSKNGAAVILLHGYKSNRQSMVYHAEMLSRNGFGVLLYDERASGASGGKMLTWGWRDVEDIPAAIAFLQSQSDVEPNRIGVMGVSTGAEIALQATARYPALQAVFSDGAAFSKAEDMPLETLEDYAAMPSDWLMLNFLSLYTGAWPRSGLIEAIPRISPRAVVFVSTGTDWEMRIMRKDFGAAGEPKFEWNIPEAQHALGIVTRPAEYEKKMVGFFSDYLVRHE